MKNKLMLSLIFGMVLLIGIGSVSAFDWEDNSIISYYAFENDTLCQNNITGGVNGTLFGTITAGVTGKIGKAYNFTSDYGAINITGISDTSQDYSFQFWLQSRKPVHDSIIFDSQTGRLYLLTYGSGVGGDIRATGNAFEPPTGTANLTLDSWQHLIFVTNTTGWFLFVNGTRVGAIPARSAVNIGGKILIGNIYQGDSPETGAGFTGLMDEVAIWNRSLSQSEITELYNSGDGITYGETAKTNFVVNLTSPTNNSILSLSNLFNVSLSMTGTATDNEWINNTYHLWYSNGTVFNKTTVTGLSTNATNISKLFNLNLGKFLWNSYACYGNLTFDNCSWGDSGNYSYSVNSSVNSNTYNSTAYETGVESYILNITSPAGYTPTNAYLVYNGTNYATTVTASGSSYLLSKTLQIPSSQIGANSFYYKWNLSSTFAENSSVYNQTISTIQFGLCNATLTVPYLNLTFKDEATSDWMTASIPSSTFVYYLGDGTENKTLSFINNTVNSNYQFCFLPANKTYHIDPYLQYKNGTDYPQRIWNPDLGSYTNATSNVTLYLLSATDGIHVIFQIVNTADQLLSGVAVTASRLINSVSTTVASGITGADGTVTFWLNPDFSHDLVFTKTGYTTYTTSLIPTQTSYTITMSTGGGSIPISYMKGIIKNIFPINRSLINDTIYTFGINLTSSYWDIEEYGFSLRLLNGSIISGGSTVTQGDLITINYNTTNQTRIFLDYYWVVNETYTNGTMDWKVYNTGYTQWSIKTFFVDLNLYLDSGIFGIDNFGRYLLIFLTLLITSGILGYKFGMNSPLFISGIIFFIIFFMDVAAGIIPPITVMNGREIPFILTFASGLIFLISILWEVNR